MAQLPTRRGAGDGLSEGRQRGTSAGPERGPAAGPRAASAASRLENPTTYASPAPASVTNCAGRWGDAQVEAVQSLARDAIAHESAEAEKRRVRAVERRRAEVSAERRAGEVARRAAEAQRRGYSVAGLLDRVRECGSVPVFDGQVVGLGTSCHGVRVLGVGRCGSRWCPDCRAAKSGADLADNREIFRWAAREGHDTGMVTLTASHYTRENLDAAGGDVGAAIRAQDVTELFDLLSQAWRIVTSGKGGVGLRKLQIGYVRAFEVTLDDLTARSRRTGTHGHYHVAAVCPRGAFEEYGARLCESWAAACERVGLVVSEKALDVRLFDDADQLAAYVTKGEKWSLAAEVGQAERKEAGTRRLSPEQLLRLIGGAGYQSMRSRDRARLVAQWRELERACKGRRWMTWSRSIREDAQVGPEISAEAAAEQVEGRDVFMTVHSEVAEHLGEVDRVAQVADDEGRTEAVAAVLDAAGVFYVVVTAEEWAIARQWMSVEVEGAGRADGRAIIRAVVRYLDWLRSSQESPEQAAPSTPLDSAGRQLALKVADPV